MDRLPVEIIENILLSRKVTIEDLYNVSLTCRYFRDVVSNSNKVWKMKLFQRWPELIDYMENKQIDFRDEVRYIYELRRRTREMLEKMPPKLYKKYEISDSDMEDWRLLLEEREEVYYYLVADLMEIVHTDVSIKSIETVPFNTPGNKTLQYYAGKVLRFVRQIHISKLWEEYMSLPPERQILEIGAVLVAQWCQPNVEVRLKCISLHLDKIAEEVKDFLSITFPNHPLLRATADQLNLWRSENRTNGHQWNRDETKMLMSVLHEVFFQHVGYQGNNQAYYMPQNSFINEVLEKRQGLPITLAIIFEAVARRLGLKCEPISFPAHFLLRFRDSYEGKSEWYYIDVFNGGQIVKRGACPMSNRSTNLYPIATAAEVVERMANNLEVSARQHAHPNGRITRLRSSLELLKLVNPKDLSALVSLARLYMLHNMDTKPLEQFLLSLKFDVPEQAQRIVHMLRDYSAHQCNAEGCLPFSQVEAAQRSPNLLYAVGMVMKHLTLNYRCVIYDWDPVCLAAAEWQVQNNVDKLKLKGDQPFYNVLVEDGSHRYVAQENLKPTSDKGAIYLNEDVGRHFSHFFETHYVPNAEKEKEYPSDKKVRHLYYQRKKLESFNV